MLKFEFFFAWGIYIDYVRQKILTCKISEIKGGPNFGPPDTNFEILGPKEAPGGSINLKNGSGRRDYLYFNPLHTFLVHQGGGRNGEKLRYEPFIAFLGYFLGVTESSSHSLHSVTFAIELQ